MVVISWSDHREKWRGVGFSNGITLKSNGLRHRVTVVGAERSIQLSYNRTPILTAQGESVIIIIADSCGKCK